MHLAPITRHGFTLTELSIVLVIIGLIVGSVPAALAEGERVPATTVPEDDRHAVGAPTEEDTAERCAAQAKAFWNALAPGDKRSLKDFIAAHPYVSATLPEAISALQAGKASQAREIVRNRYGVDGKIAANVASLMAYANGIESACPPDEKPRTVTKGENDGKK